LSFLQRRVSKARQNLKLFFIFDIRVMNALIRQKLTEKLFEKAKMEYVPELTYKHCRALSIHLDCEPNSVARLLGLENFKATQLLSPELENKIADFLGYKSFEQLENLLMLEVVFFDFRDFFMERCENLKKESLKSKK